jgi:hypothetical protein
MRLCKRLKTYWLIIIVKKKLIFLTYSLNLLHNVVAASSKICHEIMWLANVRALNYTTLRKLLQNAPLSYLHMFLNRLTFCDLVLHLAQTPDSVRGNTRQDDAYVISPLCAEHVEVEGYRNAAGLWFAFESLVISRPNWWIDRKPIMLEIE